MRAFPTSPKDPYQAEDDHRTLTRAEEVRSDKKRMAAVKAHHAKTTRAMSKVARTFKDRKTSR